MRVFLWFALFRKRMESRLFFSFLFFYGKVQVGDDSIQAYFNEILPFVVCLLYS